MYFRNLVVSFLLIFTLFGCAANPVTGHNELNFVSQASEIEMGLAYYEPLQQSAGGIYDRDPELSLYVSNVVKRLGAVSDRPELPYEIVILDSDTVNAWALPGGKMAINRGLLQALENEAELAAVLGHEMVHSAARHSARQMERSTILMAGLALANATLTDNQNRSLILAGASAGTYLLSLKYSRIDEKEADHYGMIYMEQAGYDPQQAVSLQKTFVRLFEQDKPGVFSQLLASHPPSSERVEANQQLANTMSQDLYIGEEAYKKATQKLKADMPAYDAINIGFEALEKHQLDLAKEQADKAIQLAPDLYQSYRLLGLIAVEKKDYAQALIHQSKAIQLYPHLFSIYYERGLTHEKLGNLPQARQDYVASLERLQTKDADDALKRIDKLRRREARKAQREQIQDAQ